MAELHLPPELLYSILDCVQDDHTTLRAASLVSRSWVQPSHRHLLRKILLDQDKKITAFYAYIQDSTAVFGYITSLRIVGAALQLGWDGYESIVKITQNMPLLAVVAFQMLDLSGEPPSTITAGANGVRDLTLAHIAFSSYQAAFIVLQTFPVVCHLTLNACSLEPVDGSIMSTLQVPPPIHPFALETLVLLLHRSQSSSLAPLLLKLFDKDSPRNIQIQASVSLTLLSKLCEGVGEAVHSLYFLYDSAQDDQGDVDVGKQMVHLNLPNLRSIHLRFLSTTEPVPFHGHELAEALFKFPTTRNASSLDLVEFDLRGLGNALQDESYDEDDSDWEDVYDTIRETERLVKAQVLFTEEQAERKVVQQLRDGLKDLRERGLVHIHVGLGKCQCDEGLAV